jgi:hypothetical protein
VASNFLVFSLDLHGCSQYFTGLHVLGSSQGAFHGANVAQGCSTVSGTKVCMFLVTKISNSFLTREHAIPSSLEPMLTSHVSGMISYHFTTNISGCPFYPPL